MGSKRRMMAAILCGFVLSGAFFGGDRKAESGLFSWKAAAEEQEGLPEQQGAQESFGEQWLFSDSFTLTELWTEERSREEAEDEAAEELSEELMDESAQENMEEPSGESPEESTEEEKTEEEAPTEASDGQVALGKYQIPFGQVGGTITLAFPIRYIRADQADDTHQSANGQSVPYGGSSRGGFDQSVGEELLEMWVTVDGEQEADFPLEESILNESRSLLSQGENEGYAVFSQVSVREDALPGQYPIRLRVFWREGAEQSEPQSAMVTAMMEIMPLSLTHEGGIIVFTFDELENAIENESYTTIYLGYCAENPAVGETINNGVISFTKAGGISVPRSLAIIGTDPRNGKRMKLIDYNSLAETDTIRAGTAGITMSLKHVDVEGRNFYGILCGMARDSVGIEFVDVNYTGSQMAHSRGANAWTSFRDCKATIQNVALSLGEEVAEAAEVRLYGSNTFTRTGTGANSMFWLNNTPRKLTVDTGSDTYVKTNNYFTFPGTGSTLIVDGRLDVETSGASGSMTYTASAISQVQVGGSLQIRHNSTAAYSSLQVGQLTVTGVLDIERLSSSAHGCIGTWGTGASVEFANPKRVSLQNPGGALILAEYLSGTYSIQTQGLNFWPVSSSAKLIWNNNELSPWTVSGSISGSGTAVSAVQDLPGNTGVALNAPAVSTANCNLGRGNRMLLGQYAAAIDEDTVYFTSQRVSGTAPVGSTQILQEYQGASSTAGSLVQSQPVATAGGAFETGEDWSPISGKDNRVYLLSTLDELEIHIYRDCKEVCFLYDVPPVLAFETVAISGEAQWVRRQITDWTVKILDTRNGGTWKLSASATPLTRSDGEDSLPNALVFVPEAGSVRYLSEGASVLIGEKPIDAIPGIMELSWAEDQGILVRLDPYDGTPAMSYTSTIVWTLEDS